MRSQPQQNPVHSFGRDRCHRPYVTSVTSVFLVRVAKHLAVLACLMIVGKATGRFTLGEFGIFLVTLLAAMAHLFGRALSLRSPEPPFKSTP